MVVCVWQSVSDEEEKMIIVCFVYMTLVASEGEEHGNNSRLYAHYFCIFNLRPLVKVSLNKVVERYHIISTRGVHSLPNLLETPHRSLDCLA